MMVNRHPDNIDKSADSNISLFWQAIEDVLHGCDDVVGMFEVLADVERVKDIEFAEGDVLDLIGRDVGQPRITDDDNFFRLLIQSRIQANISAGDLDSMSRFAAAILQIDVGDLSINEVAPATIYISIPEGALSGGITLDQFMLIMRRVKPAGVGFWTFVDGTFEFASGDEIEIDSDIGFADDAQTQGGTLSYIEQ